MLVLSSVNLGKEGLITDLTQESTHYCLCVFVFCRYNASVKFTEGRCPGSKAMVFDKVMSRLMAPGVTVPNVNIGDCDYTIAFWIRSYRYAEIFGSSRSGKRLALYIRGMYAYFHEEDILIDTRYTRYFFRPRYVFMNNWTHIALTCAPYNGVKMFFNGELAKFFITSTFFGAKTLPKETFVIDYSHSPGIMDFLILGFALPREEIYDLFRG